MRMVLRMKVQIDRPCCGNSLRMEVRDGQNSLAIANAMAWVHSGTSVLRFRWECGSCTGVPVCCWGTVPLGNAFVCVPTQFQQNIVTVPFCKSHGLRPQVRKVAEWKCPDFLVFLSPNFATVSSLSIPRTFWGFFVLCFPGKGHH